MPDTATLEAKPAEVLASAPHKVEAPTFTGGDAAKQAEITAAHERAVKINELREKNTGRFKDIIGEASRPPDFTETQLSEASEKLKTTNNQTRINAIQADLTPMVLYLEAVRKSQLKGTTLETELGADAGNIMLNTADVLIKRGRLLEKFPQLQEAYGNADSPELASYIESLIARDPRFQAEMSKTLESIHKESKRLESLADNPETKKLKENKEAFEKRKTAQADAIKRSLKAMGLEDPAIEDLLKNIDAGVSNKSIRLQAEQELVKENGIEDRYPQLNDYAFALSRVDEADATLRQKREELDRLGTGRNRDGARADILMKEIARLERDLPSFQGQADAHKLNIRSASYPEADFNRDFVTLNRIKGLVSEGSALTSNIEDYRENDSKISEIEGQIKALEPAKSEEEKAKTEQEREALLKRLEASVDTAMSAFLKQKYEDYVSDQNILLNASIKEADTHNKDWKAGGLKNLKTYMDKWSKYENGSYKRDAKEIGLSIKDLADKSADGESGTRKIIAELSGFQLDPEKLKDSVASEITGTTTAYSALNTEQKAKADKIAETRTVEFEEIMAEHGEKFKERLFTEYNAASGFFDKIGVGSLKLTEDQQAILNREFSSIDKKLEESGFWKSLKEKGWDGKKKHWIIALLLLLGGAVAVAGIAPTAVAVGTAAKGIGGAAWSEGLV